MPEEKQGAEMTMSLGLETMGATPESQKSEAPVGTVLEDKSPQAPKFQGDPQKLDNSFEALTDKLGKEEAYNILQKALSQPKVEQPKTPEAPVDAPNTDAVIQKYAQEYLDKGYLSPEAFNAFAKEGISGSNAVLMMQGLKAQYEQARQSIISIAGSQEDYNQLLAYVRTNYTKEEQEAFTRAQQSNDPTYFKLAVENAKLRMGKPLSPSLGSPQGNLDVYSSQAEAEKALKAIMNGNGYGMDRNTALDAHYEKVMRSNLY